MRKSRAQRLVEEIEGKVNKMRKWEKQLEEREYQSDGEWRLEVGGTLLQQWYKKDV